MGDALPEGIVAAAMGLARELAEWCARAQDRDLAAHEAAVLERVRAAQAKLLRAVVEEATSGLHPRLGRAPHACPGCGERVGPHGAPRPRQVLTRCGVLDLERPWFHCAGCGHGWGAADAVLGLGPRARLSGGAAEWATRLGAATDFREAAGLLEELTGLALGAETVRRHAGRAGAALREAEDAAVAEVERTREAAGEVTPAAGLLVVETDGAMVRYLDGWHEVKLGLVGGWQDGELVAPSYVAKREEAAPFGRRLLCEAARRGALEIERWAGEVTGRGLAVLRAVAVLGDGAAWIWHAADEHLAERVEILDFFHAAEHLGTVARALFGEGAAAEEWRRARAAELRGQGPDPVLAALRAARAPSKAAAKVLRRERGYFRRNAGRMQYPTYREDGLPIGSGAIESAADHLVQRRLKRAGMRWSVAGADALLALRAHLRSGRPLPSPAAHARAA